MSRITVSIKEMLATGAHFGHQTSRWNPKMRPFIYGSRSGIHILDLQQTIVLAAKALQFVVNQVAKGTEVLFVGTKRQAQDIIATQATRAQMHFVSKRWLGGALTNFQTIRNSINRLIELETKRAANEFEGLTKKERLNIDREITKLEGSLGGIKKLHAMPGMLFVIDPQREKIAVHEANVLGIPVVAMVDSNCDPDMIDFPIPANDDSIRAVDYLTTKVADACLLGLARREERARSEVTAQPAEKIRSRESKKIEGRGRAYVTSRDRFEGGDIPGAAGRPASGTASGAASYSALPDGSAARQDLASQNHAAATGEGVASETDADLKQTSSQHVVAGR